MPSRSSVSAVRGNGQGNCRGSEAAHDYGLRQRDQLTPEQIARFERAEQLCMTGAHLAFPQNDRSKTLADMLDGVLKEARWEAQQNLTDAQ
jgi:hypothetical protein